MIVLLISGNWQSERCVAPLLAINAVISHILELEVTVRQNVCHIRKRGASLKLEHFHLSLSDISGYQSTHLQTTVSTNKLTGVRGVCTLPPSRDKRSPGLGLYRLRQGFGSAEQQINQLQKIFPLLIQNIIEIRPFFINEK